jgi:hypothetical protein
VSTAYDPHDPPLMGCGHTANSTLQGKDGQPDRPACVICTGIVPGALEVVERPSLEGREAVCAYCRRTTPSRWSLAFFNYNPGQKYDGHYDGCRGWD